MGLVFQNFERIGRICRIEIVWIQEVSTFLAIHGIQSISSMKKPYQSMKQHSKTSYWDSIVALLLFWVVKRQREKLDCNWMLLRICSWCSKLSIMKVHHLRIIHSTVLHGCWIMEGKRLLVPNLLRLWVCCGILFIVTDILSAINESPAAALKRRTSDELASSAASFFGVCGLIACVAVHF